MSRGLPAGLWVGVAGALALVFGGQYGSDQAALAPDASFFSAVLGRDAAVAGLAHALIGLFTVVALAVALTRRKVVVSAKASVATPLFVLAGLLAGSVLVSRFRGPAVLGLPEWLLGIATLFAVLNTVGRRRGPLVAIAGIFVGGVVLALIGILEYGETKTLDPNWRIFAGWINPNATAAAYLIALGLGVGLVGATERLAKIGAVVGTGLVLFALLLTQSRGGIAVGAVVLLVGTLVSFSPARLAGVLLAVALGAGLNFAAHRPTAPPPGAGAPVAAPASRLADVSGGDQSSQFRKNLYLSAPELIRRHPLGVGVGGYRFFSAEPGTTTQTVLAHNHYLQLAIEATVFAPLALVVALLAWAVQVLRRPPGEPAERRPLRAGVFAAVFGVSLHGLVDSDLYYFGVLYPYFALLGVGLLLAADGATPELIAPVSRRLAAVGVGIVGLLALTQGLAEAARSQARTLVRTGDRAGAQAALGLSRSLAPWDGEAVYLAALAATSPEERLRGLRDAVALAPSTRFLRALAREQARAGDADGAVRTLDRALDLDPNNLFTLNLRLQTLRDAGRLDEAAETARRLVAVEDTVYYKVRSLPEIIPTETLDARMFLQSRTSDPAERRRLLRAAVDGYLKFAEVTVPTVRRAVGTDLAGEMAGVGLDEIARTLETARTAADLLAGLYRDAGDAAGERAAREAAARFASVAK